LTKKDEFNFINLKRNVLEENELQEIV